MSDLRATPPHESDARSSIYAGSESADSIPVGEEVEWEEDPREEPPTETKEEPEPEPEPEPSQPQPTEQMVRVKVDGVEQELPLSEVLAGYQKTSAADKRLAEASRLRDEMRDLRAELEKLRAPKEEPKKPVLPPAIEGELRRIGRKMLETTDEEEFAELEVEKARLIRQASALEFEEREQRRAFAQQAQEQRQAHESFLAKTRELEPDFDRFVSVSIDEGRVDLVDPAFEQWFGAQPKWMRDVFLSSDPTGPAYVIQQYKAATNPTRSLEERRERKRTIDVVPTGNRRAAKPEEQEDEDNASYTRRLQEMRQPRRGVAV